MAAKIGINIEATQITNLPYIEEVISRLFAFSPSVPNRFAIDKYKHTIVAPA